MMALQQFVCCFTVLIIFFCKGCHSQQPACGIRAVNSSSNITGAHDAAPGSWPWFAFIKAVGVFSGSFGGSLINEQWVLTEASLPIIFQSFSSSLVVYLGRNSRSGPNPNEVTRTVVNITCHPGFNSSTLENDICLLKLSAPVNFTDYIWPICLASGNSTFNNETSSWTIGFGGISSNNLKEEIVPIVGNNVCTASRPELTDNIICTRQTDSCWFTFGVPLMTQSGSVWVQSGVLIVPGCFETPSAYTPVSQYQKWIRDTTLSSAPPTAAPTTPPTADPTTPPTAPPTAAPTTPSSAPPTAAPTTPSSAPPIAPPTAAPTTPPTAPPTAPPTTCGGVFCSGENLIHFTHFTSLCVLVVLLHVFAATVGN